jgi:hypothetical protein
MVRRISLFVALATGFALVVASPAAAVTVGQLAPGSSPDALCSNGPNDSLTPTVTSGNSYVIPALAAPYGMTATSWSTNAAAGAGQTLTFKVFRKIGDPATYRVVGHDGPHPLTPSVVNTFPTSIAVQAGDVIGLNDENAIDVPNACDFVALGEASLYFNGSIPDGSSRDFSEFDDYLHNISAEVSANAAPSPVKKKKCKRKKKHKSGAVVAKKCKKKHRH